MAKSNKQNNSDTSVLTSNPSKGSNFSVSTPPQKEYNGGCRIFPWWTWKFRFGYLGNGLRLGNACRTQYSQRTRWNRFASHPWPNLHRLTWNYIDNVFEAFPAHNRMGLNLPYWVLLVFIAHIIVRLLRWVADHPTLLCHALDKSNTDRSITRINKTDIILNFVESFWIVVNKKSQRFTKGYKRILQRRRNRRRKGVRQ